MKSPRLKLLEITEMRPVAARGRQPNAAYRVREHLTEDEMARLLATLKRNRHGQRDWLIGLLIYRHGLRVSEACDLRWDDIDLPKRTIIVRRLKGSTDSSHYLERDEHKALGDLRRAYAAKDIKSDYVFVNERGHGHRAQDRTCRRSCRAVVFGACAYAAAFDGLCPGRQGNGHAAPPALPRPCQDHEHGTLHGDVT